MNGTVDELNDKIAALERESACIAEIRAAFSAVATMLEAYNADYQAGTVMAEDSAERAARLREWLDHERDWLAQTLAGAVDARDLAIYRGDAQQQVAA